MSIFGLFRRPAPQPAVDPLYRQIVARARSSVFYADLGVPDTPDGRWDMIAVHAVLVLRRLHEAPAETATLAQALFDLMFADMDQNLRELGVGDLAVGKRIKGMAKGFYGRLSAYDAGLRATDDAELRAALRRNVYRKAEPSDAQLAALAGYVRRCAATLEAQPLERLVEGIVDFGAGPGGLEPPR